MYIHNKNRNFRYSNNPREITILKVYVDINNQFLVKNMKQIFKISIYSRVHINNIKIRCLSPLRTDVSNESCLFVLFP